MRDLAAIVALYERLDTGLEGIRGEAAAGAGQDRVEQWQRINDQAYFVLAWGQFEAAIEDACREAVRRGQAHPSWTHRRAWSLYNPDDRRLSGLSFTDRLTLVLERGGDNWKLAMKHYNLRNQIAHGTLLPERIDVSSVERDFYLIQSALTRS